MGNRTLYVRKEDEDVWQEAASLGDANLSELATQGLRLVLAARRAEDDEGGVPTGEDAQAVTRFVRPRADSARTVGRVRRVLLDGVFDVAGCPRAG